MPTPLPPKGTVLQTAEFADSLYSPVFKGAGCALTIPTGALVRLSARVVALYRGCPVAFVSCVSSTFFQPARSGSHLYTANRNTLRSVHRVEVLLALVGTHLSWSPHPPLLCFHYTTLCGICQALFLSSLIFFREDT